MPVQAQTTARTDPRLEQFLAEASRTEIPTARLCASLARSYLQSGDDQEALRWARRTVDGGDDYLSWHAASKVLQLCPVDPTSATRQIRLAVLGSSTTVHLAPLLKLAALRASIALDVYEGSYGQFVQEILDQGSGMHQFRPTHVLLAVDCTELPFATLTPDPSHSVEQEAQRWRKLWEQIAASTGSVVLQFGFVAPPENSWGHFALRQPGSRARMIQELNFRLGGLAAECGVALVNCDEISSRFGKNRWFDPRSWHSSRQPVALEALPLLARHVTSVLAASAGLTRKCLVLDLDNTLWGGVIGEDRLTGIRLAEGPQGEAFCAFQDYILSLKERGILLAVCSKNDENEAREPFLKHKGMKLTLADISVFVANWRTKPENLRTIAHTLNIGLDSLVFVDDNPAERQLVRESLPEVDVIPLPADPALYTRTLSEYLFFEPHSFTKEDAERTRQYQARAELAVQSGTAGSLDDFLRGLDMRAELEEIGPRNLTRVVQLIGKTNQFNLTTRRYTQTEVDELLAVPGCIALAYRLRDRLADHGLVGVLLALPCQEVLEIDAWLMSCRVIGRTLEQFVFRELCRRARQLGYTSIRGFYLPTAKNGLVKDLYAHLGFIPDSSGDESQTWCYELSGRKSEPGTFVRATEETV